MNKEFLPAYSYISISYKLVIRTDVSVVLSRLRDCSLLCSLRPIIAFVHFVQFVRYLLRQYIARFISYISVSIKTK